MKQFKAQIQPLLVQEGLETEAQREAAVAEISRIRGELSESTTPGQKLAIEAAVRFASQDPNEMQETRAAVSRVRKAVKRKAQTVREVSEASLAEAMGSISGETPQDISQWLDGDETDLDNGESMSAFFTKIIEVDATSLDSNQKGREMILRHTRKAEADHVILSAAAKRWLDMTGSRGGDYDKVKGERPGEALLKALNVMYEAGIRTDVDLLKAVHAQELYSKYTKTAKSRPEYDDFIKANPKTTRIGEVYFWDSPEDVVKVEREGQTYYVVPESKRRSALDALEAYNAHRLKIKKGGKLAAWTDVMADYAKTLDDAASRMNDNVGFEWVARHENRSFHVLHTPDRGSTKAPNLLGQREEGENYHDRTSYLDRAKGGSSPLTFNIAENFAAWLNSTSSKAKLLGVLRSSALTVDVNGVPGMILGAEASEAGEKLTPYDREVGFIMLNNLRKKLSEAKGVIIPALNRNRSPWVQASELATENPAAMAGLGYVPLKSHALGPNIDQVWAIQGTLDRVVRHVSYTGVRGRLQQAKADKAFWRTQGWRTASNVLKVTKFLKGLNVGFSAFHHLALAESAVANVGVTFKNPIFHLGNYWMAGARGLKLYREMTNDPEVTAKWAGRGLKASTLPIDALHYEMSSGWFSRAGHALRNGGRGVFRKNKLGSAVGSSVLAAGNVKRRLDNFLWHGMVPVMKVHMAERMFEQFRADPRLAHLTDEQIGHDIAKYTNDALGSQEWEQYLFMNPLMQDWANMIMFAPDWTLSALNVAGMSKAMSAAFGLDGPMDYTDDAFDFTNSPMVRHRWAKYIPGFFMNVLVMPTVAIQAMLFTFFGGDPDDEMWTWNNEEGKKFLIDFTPLMRHYYTQVKGVTPPERRAYLTPGKQLREVAGWLQHPAKTFYGKSSNVVRMSNLIVFKSKTHPFSPQPWTVDREDVAMEAMYSVLPFVLSGWLADNEVPLGMRTFLTVTRGASEWTLANRASEVYLDAASGSGFERMTPRAKAREMNRRLEEIWRSADINGVDVRTVQVEGRKQARTEYNKRLTSEMIKTSPNADAMQEALLGLAVLEPNYRERLNSLRRTVDYRVKRSAKLSEEEKARIQKLYDSLKFRAQVRKVNDTHAKAWGRMGGVQVEP